MEGIESKYEVDVSEALRSLERLHDAYREVDKLFSAGGIGASFTKATQEQKSFNQALGQNIQINQRVEATARAYKTELDKLSGIYTNLTKRQREYVAAGQYDALLKDLDKVQKRMREIEAESKRLGKIKPPRLEDKPDKPGSGNRDEKGRFLPGTGSASGGLQNVFNQDIGKTIKQLGALSVAGYGAAEVGRMIVTEWAAFGKKLSEVGAITGLTGKDLQFLSDQAGELEATTGIAGTEILEAFKNIGSIKPEILESKEALADTTKEIIALAQASGLSLPDAAKAAIGSLNQFGEAADQTARFVNVLAAGALLGSSEVNDTAEALQNSGTAMKAAGLSFEQGNALLQVLAKGMIKGSEAGTALRNMLLKLETSADKNLRPSVVGLDVALENASKKFKTTTDLTKAFGVENVVASKQILDARAEVTKLTEAVTGTGVAYEQQRKNLDNFSSDLTKAGTATSAFFRSIGESQDGFFRKMVQGYTNFLAQLTGKNTELKSFFSGFVSGFQEQGGILGAFSGAFGAANKTRQANLATAQTQARIRGITNAAKSDVDGETSDLVKSYQKRGVLLPQAQKQAASVVAKERDAELTQARAAHNKLRKELETGTADQKKTLKARFDASRARILAAEVARKQALSNESRLNKQEADQKKALASALGEPDKAKAKGGKSDADRLREEQYRTLLKAQEEYQSAAQKLIETHGKERLDGLREDGEAYILEKAKLDKEELDLERQKLESLLQIARSTKTKRNGAGQLEVVADTSVTIKKDAPELDQLFADRQKQIDDKAATDLAQFRLDARIKLLGLERKYNELELAENERKWVQLIAREKKGSEEQKNLIRLQQQETERILLGQAINQNRDGEAAADAFINQDAFERQLRDGNKKVFDIEAERQKAILRSRIFFQEKLVELLRGQGEAENAVLISQTKALIDGLKRELGSLESAPKFRDIYDLLGISKEFASPAEREIFLQGVQAISQGIQAATAAIVEASEMRLNTLNNEIAGVEEQLRIELDRRKEGQANNADLRKAELDDLKRQKAEEQKVRRDALATQQTLDTAAMIANNAVSVSNMFVALTNITKGFTTIPIAGVALAIGGIATILATILGAKAKLKSISQLEKGGRIPLDGRSHREGGHRIEGTDIEVERGEHVVNRLSSQLYDEELTALNSNDPRKAFLSLMKKTGFGLPSMLIANHKQVVQQSLPATTAQAIRLDTLEGIMSEVLLEIKKKPPVLVGLGEGKVLEKDGSKTTITDYGKRS